MKLHHGNLSSSSRRGRITAKLFNLPLEELSADLRSPSDRAELVICVTPLMMTKLARLPTRPYQNVRAWLSRLQELPVWKETEVPELAQLEGLLQSPP